jgi:hypothetical protein
MKKVNKIISGVLSISLIAALAACSDTTTVDGTTAAPGATTTAAPAATTTAAGTTAATVEVVTTEFDDVEKDVITKAAEKLPAIELAAKEIKWLSHYDINPNNIGQAKSPAIALFEQKYGGIVTWYETTWGTRYDDLSTLVLGGEGVDVFAGDDESNFPKGYVNGMFQPVNDYINLDDAIWDPVREGLSHVTFGGEVLMVANGVNARHVLFYNKDTIEANGLEDPYEQWQNGEWNWDTMKQSLLDFVDTDNDQWGLDGYWYERALVTSTGKPYIGSDPNTGLLVSNMDTEELALVGDYGYDLFTNGLVCDRATTQDNIQPARMGDGRELFYITGAYEVWADPSTWQMQIPPESLGMVPVPSPAGYDTTYVNTRVDGFALLKGAANPEGVVAFAMCGVIAANEPDLVAITQRQYETDYKLTEEVRNAEIQINQMARDNPVIELAAGASDDIWVITACSEGDNLGMRAAFHGIPWATTREESGAQLQTYLDDFNAQFQAALDASQG